MILTINKVSKQFKDKIAVKDFTTELSWGIYGLLGPNGAGKTTIMRIIADVSRPSTGEILVDGKNKVPQNSGFYKNFTAEEFLYYISD